MRHALSGFSGVSYAIAQCLQWIESTRSRRNPLVSGYVLAWLGPKFA
jgi:hypothetical protein